MKPSILVVISGPSGVGKTTVVDRLLEADGIARAVTATTREPRDGEMDGRDYVFLTREEFLARVERGEFLEHAVVHDRLYGTPRSQVQAVLDREEDCLLNVDVQGAQTVREMDVGPMLSVFLLPPDEETLVQRLRGRGSEDEERLARRIENARAEMARASEFDAQVVNDVLDRAVDEIRALIEERRRCVPEER